MIVLQYLPHATLGEIGGRYWCAFDEETQEGVDYQPKRQWLEDDLRAQGVPYKIRCHHREGGYTDRVIDAHLKEAKDGAQ